MLNPSRNPCLARYFLKKAIIFVDKPVLYIRYDEIVYVEFSNAAGSRGATRCARERE